MNVPRRGTVARAAPTARGLSSAGAKQATNSGLTGAAARLWVRGVGIWLGGQRTEPGSQVLRCLEICRELAVSIAVKWSYELHPEPQAKPRWGGMCTLQAPTLLALMLTAWDVP